MLSTVSSISYSLSEACLSLKSNAFTLKEIISDVTFAGSVTTFLSHSEIDPIISKTSAISYPYPPNRERTYDTSRHDLIYLKSVATGWYLAMSSNAKSDTSSWSVRSFSAHSNISCFFTLPFVYDSNTVDTQIYEILDISPIISRVLSIPKSSKRVNLL